MAKDFVKSIPHVSPSISAAVPPQDTFTAQALAQTADTLDSFGVMLEKRAKKNAEERDARLTGEFASELAGVNELGQAQLDAIVAERESIESKLLSPSADPEDEQAVRGHIAHLERLKMLEEQTGRNMSSRVHSITAQRIRERPHLTADYLELGTKYYGFLSAAANARKAAADDDPINAERNRLLQESVKTGLPVAWLRMVENDKRQSDFLATQIERQLDLGKLQAPAVAAAGANLYTSLGKANMAALQQYGRGLLDQKSYEATITANVQAAREQFISFYNAVQGVDISVEGNVTRKGERILSPEVYNQAMASFDAMYKDAMGLSGNASQAGQYAEQLASLNSDALALRAELYPHITRLFGGGPETTRYLLETIPAARQLLAQHDEEYVLRGVAVQDPEAMLAWQLWTNNINGGRQAALARGEFGLADKLTEIMTLAAQNKPVAHLIPENALIEGFMIRAISEAIDNPTAPRDAREGFVNTREGLMLRSQTEALRGKRPFHDWANDPNLPRSYAALEPKEKDAYVAAFHQNTTQFLNDKFSFGLAGGLGRYAKNIVLGTPDANGVRKWEFQPDETMTNPGTSSFHALTALNFQMEHFKKIGVPYAQLQEHQALLEATVRGHEAEWDKKAESFMDVFSAVVKSISAAGGNPVRIGQAYRQLRAAEDGLGGHVDLNALAQKLEQDKEAGPLTEEDKALKPPPRREPEVVISNRSPSTSAVVNQAMGLADGGATVEELDDFFAKSGAKKSDVENFWNRVKRLPLSTKLIEQHYQWDDAQQAFVPRQG